MKWELKRTEYQSERSGIRQVKINIIVLTNRLELIEIVQMH